MMTDYIWMIIWFNTKPSQCKASDYRNCGWNCVTLYGFRARSTLVFIWSLGFQVQYLSFPVQYQERDCGSWPSPRESSPHNSLLCNQQTPANTKPNTKAFIQIQKYQNTNRQTGTVSLHILLKECFDFCRFRWLMITALKPTVLNNLISSLADCPAMSLVLVYPIDLEGTFLKLGFFGDLS